MDLPQLLAAPVDAVEPERQIESIHSQVRDVPERWRLNAAEWALPESLWIFG